MKKNWIAGLMAAVLCLSLAACGGQAQTAATQPAGETPAAGTPESKDTLVVRAPKDIGDLNPHTMNSQMFAQDWVYESLEKEMEVLGK